jgi:hypothetical protein
MNFRWPAVLASAGSKADAGSIRHGAEAASAGMLADDRRVAASWFVTAGVGDDWDRFYDCLISIGRHASSLAVRVVIAVLHKFDPGPEGHREKFRQLIEDILGLCA